MFKIAGKMDSGEDRGQGMTQIRPDLIGVRAVPGRCWALSRCQAGRHLYRPTGTH